MKQQDFLRRFKSNAPSTAPAFDAAELARWAEGFRASLPAQRAALVAQFAQALELAGGKFYRVTNAAEAAQRACDIVTAHEAEAVIAWNHPALDEACQRL